LAEHYATISLLTEDCDETKKVVESQRNELKLQSALLAKREATINILTNERQSLTMDLNEAINEKSSIAKLLSTVSQERNSFFEKLKRDKDLLKEKLDELEKEMSSRSLQQTSLASRSVDIQAENQRLERDIESSLEHNEMLAANIAQLEIDKMSLEGQLSDARDEADELLADNEALRRRLSQLEAANTSITNNTNEEFKSMTLLSDIGCLETTNRTICSMVGQKRIPMFATYSYQAS
jgi:chromosome segregation ATPase